MPIQQGSNPPAFKTPSTVVQPQSQLALMQQTLTALMQARETVAAGGVQSVMIDGEQTVFSDPAQLDASIKEWERRVALNAGTRRRVVGIRMDHF